MARDRGPTVDRPAPRRRRGARVQDGGASGPVSDRPVGRPPRARSDRPGSRRRPRAGTNASPRARRGPSAVRRRDRHTRRRRADEVAPPGAADGSVARGRAGSRRGRHRRSSTVVVATGACRRRDRPARPAGPAGRSAAGARSTSSCSGSPRRSARSAGTQVSRSPRPRARSTTALGRCAEGAWVTARTSRSTGIRPARAPGSLGAGRGRTPRRRRRPRAGSAVPWAADGTARAGRRRTASACRPGRAA